MKAAYVVVTANSLIDLEEQVSKFLSDGYIPTGGAYLAKGEGTTQDGIAVGYTVWTQAVYKVEQRV